MPIYKMNGKKDGLQKYNVRINYTDNYGKAKQMTRTTYGMDAAKDLERQLSNNIKTKELNPAANMTVSQLLEEYTSVKKYEAREVTIAKNKQNFEYYILPTFSDIHIDKITTQQIQKWKISMEEKNLSLNTKKQAFGDFRAMLNYAIKMEYISKNPLIKIGNFKDCMSIKEEMTIYTAEQFCKYINVVKSIAENFQAKNNSLSEWDYYVFFNIAFYTGLRKGEIHALKWNDINGSYLSVKRSITQRLKGGDRETPPKNKSSVRTLHIPLPLLNVLSEHKKRQEQIEYFKEDYRICGGTKSLRDTTIQRRNIDYATKAGLDVIRVHDFRHSHVSVLANEGINIQEIARRLGHARIEMTWNTYSHLYPREEERAVDILNRIA